MKQNSLSLRLISDIFANHTPNDVINSIELIKQHNLEKFSPAGFIEELKRQQYLLEVFESILKQEGKDSL